MGVFERNLTIKRVPTVLSNYQEEDGGSASENIGCGRNCLGKCCLLGIFLFASHRFFCNFCRLASNFMEDYTAS